MNEFEEAILDRLDRIADGIDSLYEMLVEMHAENQPRHIKPDKERFAEYEAEVRRKLAGSR